MKLIYGAAKRWARTAIVVGMTVLMVCQSRDCSVAAGVVLSFGSNSNGKTGQGTSSGDTLIATPIDTTNLAGVTITQVAAGANHSLLLSEAGIVSSFGSNSDGRTGLGSSSGSTLVATPIDATNLMGRTVTQVAAGTYHSLLLANDGTVFSFGANADGQTGLGFSSGTGTIIATPIDTTNLAGRAITQVAAGTQHSLLLANDGTVFSFGSNAYGRTGLGTASGLTLTATQIDTTNLAGKVITQVAAGERHSLLLANDGSVYSFGDNNNGQTGLGTNDGITLVATPIDTTYLAGTKITQVAAGADHSLLLNDTGAVFSFGSSDFGQGGLGPLLGSRVAIPIDTSNLAGKEIMQVATGANHSLLLASDGTAFSFGSNGRGRTGLGTDSGYSLIAMPIDTTNLAILRVNSTSAGGTHNLLLAVPKPGLPGDYNGNSAVDAADYVVWRDNEGTTNVLPNDQLGGTIGQAQYDQWRANLGHSAGSGAGASSNAPVPEPTSALLPLSWAAAGASIRRRVAPRVPSTRKRLTLVNKPPFSGHRCID